MAWRGEGGGEEGGEEAHSRAKNQTFSFNKLTSKAVKKIYKTIIVMVGYSSNNNK